ncbi:hypothetical protein CLV42_108253 [Chitinophaga ginsengisoli]|uniref:Uncharacterized protein n=1 Tax=Chitinophaga ginsengisoli TaxID=363837 RepID=A0A2P8G2W4_9BACT|nr:hypothetical protein CLV42_108253 [Chitinophaga ginsengisoli]
MSGSANVETFLKPTNFFSNFICQQSYWKSFKHICH